LPDCIQRKNRMKPAESFIPIQDQYDQRQFSEPERAAMRANLQRCEVRLSSLHRIATAFISGAGLLLLIPIFFKDVIDNIMVVLLAQTTNHFDHLGVVPGWMLTSVLFLLIVYPIFLSLAIPLYGVYLLLKDVVDFYFTVHTPGFPDDMLHPTFSLAPVAFSADESLAAKREIMRYQYQPDKIAYMLPFSEKRRELYFDQIVQQTHSGIIPPTRQWDALDSLGVLESTKNDKDISRYNAALGITGTLDRTLAQEVAVTEMLLVRNVMYLRRLVLRYVKVLLMFIWTMFIAFMMLPLLKDGRFPELIILAAGYLVWALAVIPILSTPLNWLYRHIDGETTVDRIDAQLLLFERGIRRYVFLAILAAAAGLPLAIWAALG